MGPSGNCGRGRVSGGWGQYCCTQNQPSETMYCPACTCRHIGTYSTYLHAHIRTYYASVQRPAPEAPLLQLCHGWCLVQSHVSHVTCVCLLLLFCSHYQIVVVSYSPGVSFDRSRPPNEVFGEDRFVPYETVSHMCEDVSACP